MRAWWAATEPERWRWALPTPGAGSRQRCLAVAPGSIREVDVSAGPPIITWRLGSYNVRFVKDARVPTTRTATSGRW